ncbi:SusC/RagA family TonB-linked outer membrane protein [Niabella sp. CJ426]|uniref:SusC/RagA family TonB-linked outer membrane protein n=1 Tax=Niabella sp. CJ426 TaxID=3393740 RepID=UPI003D028384
MKGLQIMRCIPLRNRNHKWAGFFLFFLAIFSSSAGFAQTTTIRGNVISDAGSALPNVSVQVKSSTVGTTTDSSGNFTINVPGANAILVFSSIGYTEKEEALSGRTELNVVLTASAQNLEQVVVIGYGTATKRDLTGSVAKVSGAEIASQPNVNPLSSLQAKVTGLNIVNNAVPGTAPDVRIRGTISVGTVRPVYIIDGIFSDNLDFVNPSDIESVEVLKDPSSLAVFGIKGAAGAILVTTKKARAGQTNINFNTSIGVKQLVDKIAMANGDEFRKLLTFEANNRVKDDPKAGSLLDFVNNGMAAYNGNTDWVDAVTRDAIFSTTNLSIDGSSERNRFRIGLGYTYDEGLVKHIRYDRLTLSLNDEYKVTKNIKVGVNLIGSKERLPYGSDALEQARRALPIIPDGTTSIYSKNPYGTDSANFNLYTTTPIIQNSETNPLATLENNWNKKIDDRYKIVGSAFFDYQIFTDLNFRATWYTDMSFRNNREYTPLYNLYDPVLKTVIAKNALTAVRQDRDDTRAFQQDYIATYKKKINDHSVTATAGFTTYYYTYQPMSATVSQSKPGISIIPDKESLWYLNSGFGDVKSVINTTQREYATVSGLARVLYNFKNKYYLNASFRRDGSSQINREYSKKFQNFWALGGAWEVTRESFMQDQDIFDFLKLKASTGVLGNFTAQGKDYPAYPTISSNASAVFGENLIPVYVPDYQYDPNLKWETVKSTEFGLEADFLMNRLHFETNYYTKETRDLIVLLTPVGQLPTLTNSGNIKNSGWEFAANWNDKLSNNWSYSLGGNLTTYKNKVTYLPFPLRTNISSSEATPNQAETGYPIGYFYGFVVDGIYQSNADILNSPANLVNGGNAKPGDFKYKDLNGDNIINDKDRTIIGNPTPDFTYAINASIKYRSFDLGIDMMGSYGGEIYRAWGTSEQKNSVYNYPQYYMEGWTEPGSSNWVPIVNASHLINRAPSTYGIEDGSFFRIRNLNIGYTISKINGFNSFKNLRFSLSAQNLITWKRNMGYSPEFSGDATSFGIDWGNAGSAIPRVITFGLNANF